MEISLEEYDKLPVGIIASGFISDSSTGCNIDSSGKLLRYTVNKFTFGWNITLDRVENNHSDEYIHNHGVVSRDSSNIRKCFNASEELLRLYNS